VGIESGLTPKKIEKKWFLGNCPYGLWLTTSGDRRLRGPSACHTPQQNSKAEGATSKRLKQMVAFALIRAQGICMVRGTSAQRAPHSSVMVLHNIFHYTKSYHYTISLITQHL